MTKWCVIVPTCPGREEVFKGFLTWWGDIFWKHQIHLIVMCDMDHVPVWVTDHKPVAAETTYLSWKDIKAKHIPKQTDMVRSWAFYHGYKNTDAQYFLTLDDDVRPLNLGRPHVGDIFEEYEKVFKEGEHLSEYFSVGSLTTTPMRTEMRGYPYKDRVVRPVAVQYGGWWGTLDYDAATQLSEPRGPQQFGLLTIPVPKGAAATCCIMNCAWQREYTPIMWQLPMLDGRYNRVGDIWSGLLIKKTLDKIGAVMVINGKASVLHERASNPYNSLVKEAPSVWLNDNLWNALFCPLSSPELARDISFYESVVFTAYLFFCEHDKEYAEHFLKASEEWLELWR